MIEVVQNWLPRLLCVLLAFAFWYAVKSDLGKNRDFIMDEWKAFIERKSESSRLQGTPAG